MGITGLLPLLASVTRSTHLAQFAGLRVAIDAYVWLHRGAYGCSYELCQNIPTHKCVLPLKTLNFRSARWASLISPFSDLLFLFGIRYLAYCMKMVNLLRSYKVIPVLVFDGGNLPSKRGTEVGRREYVLVSLSLPFSCPFCAECWTNVCFRRRDEAKQKGMELLQAGDKKAASECFQRAVDVTPRMAFNLIELLRKEGVEFVVAPYEADAQLTFLCLNGFVDAVISEDSDLIPYGCPRMIYKLDKDGNGKEVAFADLGAVKEIDLSRFSAEMLRHMCILSGCDYLDSLPGMGLKKAHALLARHGTMGEVFKAIFENSKITVPSDYTLNFGRADLTFQHQIVYDPKTRKTVHLHPLPEHVDPSTLPFAGEHLDDTVAQLVADGRLDPHTYEPFILSIPVHLPQNNARNGPTNGATSATHSAFRTAPNTPSPSKGVIFGHRGSQSAGASASSQATTTYGNDSAIQASQSSASQVSAQNSQQTQAKRISTQWQTKATSPLTAIRQSLATGQAQTLSAEDVSKHDNDMTRDVRRYTMFRGSGKGVKNAASTASKIISASSTPTKPSNNIHAYFQSATSPKADSNRSTPSEAQNSLFRSRAVPVAASVSTPSKLSSSSTITNSAQDLSTPNTKTLFKSRFFSSNSSTPHAIVDVPDTVIPSSSTRSYSPKPSEELASYTAVWGDGEEDDDCYILDDDLETLLTTGTRPVNGSNLNTTTTAQTDAKQGSIVVEIGSAPSAVQSPHSSASTAERRKHSSAKDNSEVIEETVPPLVKRHVPVRLSIPMKAYSMSLNGDDSDDEIELLRVNSGSSQAMEATRAEPVLERPPVVILKPVAPTPSKPQSTEPLYPTSPAAGSRKPELEAKGSSASSTSKLLLVPDSVELLTTSSTSLVVPLSDSPSIFDELDRLEEHNSLDRSVSAGELSCRKTVSQHVEMVISKDDLEVQANRTRRDAEHSSPSTRDSFRDLFSYSAAGISFRTSSTSTLAYGSAPSQMAENSARSTMTLPAPSYETTPSPNLKKRSRFEDSTSDAMLETSPPMKMRSMPEVDIFNLLG